MAKNGDTSPPKRTAAQRTADLALVEHWYTQGYTCTMIAEKISAERPYSLCRQQIQYDVLELDKNWKAEAFALRDGMKRREIESIARQERELWDAWWRSKNVRTKKSAETIKGKGKGDQDIKQKIHTEEQCGDPRYMMAILQLRERRAKLLGLDEPTKTEVTGADGAPVEVAFLDTALEKVYGKAAAELAAEMDKLAKKKGKK